MGRSCCVRECKSGKIVPLHGIPANKERRKQWLDILNLNVTEEKIIKQLRVCHKHFHNIDYSCCPTYKRLLNTAVPCIAQKCQEEHWQDPASKEFILQWCSFLNKILNGKMLDGFQPNYMYNQAKSLAVRYTKKDTSSIMKVKHLRQNI